MKTTNDGNIRRLIVYEMGTSYQQNSTVDNIYPPAQGKQIAHLILRRKTGKLFPRLVYSTAYGGREIVTPLR